MAVAIQSVSSTFSQEAGDIVRITAPTGITVGDLLIAAIFFRTTAEETLTVTAPSGFASIRINNTQNGVHLQTWWKIAGSGDAAASSFDFDGSQTVPRMGGILRINGHDPTTPINGSNGGVGLGTAMSISGITPSVANCLLIQTYACVDDALDISSYAIATDNPTWTEQFEVEDVSASPGTLALAASTARAATTATGNATATISQAEGWSGQIIAIAPSAGATSYTLTADGGSFAFTGTAAALRAARRLIAATGSAAVTGTASTLAASRTLTAAEGSVAITGTAATLQADRTLAAAAGSIALSGIDATLTYTPASGAFTLTAEAGAVTVTGTAATLRAARQLSAEAGGVALTGATAALRADRYLAAVIAEYDLTGTAAALRVARQLVAAAGEVTITGTAAGLDWSGEVLVLSGVALQGSYVPSIGISGSYVPSIDLSGSVE